MDNGLDGDAGEDSVVAVDGISILLGYVDDELEDCRFWRNDPSEELPLSCRVACDRFALIGDRGDCNVGVDDNVDIALSLLLPWL